MSDSKTEKNKAIVLEASIRSLTSATMRPPNGSGPTLHPAQRSHRQPGRQGLFDLIQSLPEDAAL